MLVTPMRAANADAITPSLFMSFFLSVEIKTGSISAN
jgi:hypothetical protein